MKTLKKENDYKRVPDKSYKDLEALNELLKDGWVYTPKKDWKENVRGEFKPDKKRSKTEKSEKVEKIKVEKVKTEKVDKGKKKDNKKKK